MGNNVVQFVLMTLVLVTGAAAEELLPKVMGVGFPVLLTAVQFFALRCNLPTVLAFAFAAGAMEDALCSLPTITSIGYFLCVAVAVRWTGLSAAVTAVTYPVYQVWLSVWMIGFGGSVYTRILLSVPFGVVTAFAVGGVLAWASRKAAVGEQG